MILIFHYFVRTSKEGRWKQQMSACVNWTVIWPLFWERTFVAMATCCAFTRPPATRNTRDWTKISYWHYGPQNVIFVLTNSYWVPRDKYCYRIGFNVMCTPASVKYIDLSNHAVQYKIRYLKLKGTPRVFLWERERERERELNLRLYIYIYMFDFKN
jgi:hypothetical protein